MRLAILALALLSATAALADDATKDSANSSDTPNAVNALFGRYGFLSSANITSSSCKIDMQIDQAVFLAHIDELKALGFLNKDLTQTATNMLPNTITMVFTNEVLTVATKEIYDDNKNADRCDFVQSEIVTDDYGNNAKIMLKVAPNFRFTPNFEALIMREQRAQ